LSPSLSLLQLIEDLRKELEYLQLYKLDVEMPGWSRAPSCPTIELTFRNKEMELEYEAKHLKQVTPGRAPPPWLHSTCPYNRPVPQDPSDCLRDSS
ncbi:hypothetical protein chiPu_0030441, partial [Chiloscyllium punctatum]|nr:hypothetical protein [Chiloscyllium punctatum]